MKRFKIVGCYNCEKVLLNTHKNTMEITVPLLDKNGVFLYGIGKTLLKMESYNIFPSEQGFDMIVLACLVYLADTKISREQHAQDSWTREIHIELPVYNVDNWDSMRQTIERMLQFLTGDLWSISFSLRKEIFEKKEKIEERTGDYDIVSLFSGGMDSLISTINYMERGKNTLLISHAGDGLTKNAQNNILKELDKLYPEIRHERIDLWMVFEQNFLLDGEKENTTRSRSFLFISLAVFAMTGTKNLKRLEIPENGLIALNVPLDNMRVGSHSTRTTHPFYLNLWNKLLEECEFNITVNNSYWNRTKGEMADECANKTVLYEIMGSSFSCSSPGKARWKHLPPQHCGYCVPCLIRRAAMYKAFGKDITNYAEESIDAILNDRDSALGVQIRSFEFAIDRIKDKPKIADLLIHKPGPLMDDEKYMSELADVYKRGLLEVGEFIQDNHGE